MKSIIRFLLISLSIFCAHSLFADTSVISLQQAHEIKAYVQAAKQLGYTDAKILSELEHAVQNFEKNNGVLALSLKYDERVVWSAIGVLSVAALGGAIWLLCYLLTDHPAGNSEPNNRHSNERPRSEEDRQRGNGQQLNQQLGDSHSGVRDPIIDHEGQD